MRKDGDAWGRFPESVESPHGYNWLCKSMFWTTVGGSPGFSSKDQRLRIKLKSEGKDHKQVPRWPILNFQLRTHSVGFLPRVFMCTCQQPDVHHVPKEVQKKDKTSKKNKNKKDLKQISDHSTGAQIPRSHYASLFLHCLTLLSLHPRHNWLFCMVDAI